MEPGTACQLLPSLSAAEAAELAQATEGALAPLVSEEEHLKRELADSRFDDSNTFPGS
jgi:hypothetical protein